MNYLVLSQVGVNNPILREEEMDFNMIRHPSISSLLAQLVDII